MDEPIDKGPLADFPDGQMKGVDVRGKRILIVNVKGALYALGDVCSHEPGYLSEGSNDYRLRTSGYEATCPSHGVQFDVRTGEVLRGPAEAPEPIHEISTGQGRVLIKI